MGIVCPQRAILYMSHGYPDFVVVVCGDMSCAKGVVEILSKYNAVALNILSYEEWIEDAFMLKYNLLLIRTDDTWLYAKTRVEKSRIKMEIEDILHRLAYNF
jgi:hypothetical protein